MKTLASIMCVIAVAWCASAQAQDLPDADQMAASSTVTCQKDSMTRIVEVTYAGQQGKPPCEVHYKKTTEQPGHDQALWDSQHTADYCETRMQEFVEKLRGMGWNCQ